MSYQTDLPPRIADIETLETIMSQPSDALVADLAAVPGDILILGAGGKMGPTLAQLARRAAPERRVVAVARFTDKRVEAKLKHHGVETVTCDLLDRGAFARLPKLPNVVFMAGRKFAAGADQPLTWATNVLLPGMVAESFAMARIVAFSTGCVYAFVDVASGGSREDASLAPPGEYANSCVGRERAFTYHSQRLGTPGRLLRLNYAIDLRYGVLHDIARRVKFGEAIDVTMGHVNVIWQGDANAMALRSLRHCTTPTTPLNVSGPETISIRWLAHSFAERFGRPPVIRSTEASSVWLTNTARAMQLFGYPLVPLETMIDWVADWIERDMPSLGRPTQFEVQDGRY